MTVNRKKLKAKLERALESGAVEEKPEGTVPIHRPAFVYANEQHKREAEERHEVAKREAEERHANMQRTFQQVRTVIGNSHGKGTSLPSLQSAWASASPDVQSAFLETIPVTQLNTAIIRQLGKKDASR